MSHEYKNEPRNFIKIPHPQDPVVGEDLPIETPSVPDKLADDLEKTVDLKENNVITMYRMGYKSCFKEMHKFIDDIKTILAVCQNHEHTDRTSCKVCEIGNISLAALQRVELSASKLDPFPLAQWKKHQ